MTYSSGFVFQLGGKKGGGKREGEANLVHQSGNGVLESLGKVGEVSNVMTHVRVNNTLGTEGSLVSFAVRVDLKMRMLLAMKNPGGG